jgi:hypothetical protein
MDHFLNSVLNAFSKMDAGLIGDLLDPQYTYQEVSFESFTKKLALIFEEFQAEGDTNLEVLDCNPDLIRTAYRFVGNNTRNYLDLRFILEPTEDLKDQIIKDIFQCNSFRCMEERDWFGSAKFLQFSDDAPGSLTNIDYIINQEIAIEAFQKLFDETKSIILEMAKAWVMKFQPTYEYFQDLLSF